MEWAQNNNVGVKDIMKKLKDDLINIVWKNLQTKDVNEDSDEEYEWEYYYEEDNETQKSDSETNSDED